MATWVISLLGIVVITLVCDVILPEGQTTKYVKTVISLIVVCATIFPLANVFVDFNYNDLFTKSDTVALQNGYLSYVKEQKQLALGQSCNKKLAENGLAGCNCLVTLDDDLTPVSVVVEVDKQYFSSSVASKIAVIVSNCVSVSKSEVTCIVD